MLDNALLASMSSGIAGQAADVNVAAEILARPYLSQDSQCGTWPVQARQGTVAVELKQDQGNLWLHIRVPNLYVYFEGECQGLLRMIPLAGEMAGTIDIWTRLTPKASGATCLTPFDHTTPQVTIAGWRPSVSPAAECVSSRCKTALRMAPARAARRASSIRAMDCKVALAGSCLRQPARY